MKYIASSHVKPYARGKVSGSLRLHVFLVLAIPTMACAQEARIEVQAGGSATALSRYMTGACIEDVNHEVYGGIYSQMIFGESFQEPPVKNGDKGVSGMWRAARQGNAAGDFEVDSSKPFVGRQSQVLHFTGGQGEIGIENRGLNRWGMNFVAGKPYRGHLWVRAEQPARIFIALQNANGSREYAESGLDVRPGDWQNVEFVLTPNESDTAGRFCVTLRQPGTVEIGYAFLEPGDWGRFKGLPVRKDVADGLVEQGLTVLRYGGSMVNAPEYRWKKMIGSRDRRPPYKGMWYPYSSNGWGIIDFVNFCEAAGFLPVPAFNMDETPRDMADFVEYMNGPADSPWGHRRVQDGHPQPYHLTHIELGNEEAVDEHYWQRFEPMVEAIWAEDPRMILVVGDFAYERKIADPLNFKGAPRIHSLAAHKKILDLAKGRGVEVWFDVHVGTEKPREPRGLGGVPSFITALAELSPGARYQVVVFELNANRHDLARALSNASAIGELERLGAQVPIVCSANCLQCDGQNDNGWNQGLLFLNPSRVWPQPPYFVTQIISRNYLPLCVPADTHSPGDGLDVTAKVSPDHKIVQLDVVNVDDRPISTRITVKGFSPSSPVAQVTELSGKLGQTNTAAEPDRVKPRHVEWPYRIEDGGIVYTFPPNSFTVLRLQ